ncbi:MAG: transcription-repair coupling factor [Clostridia bacterium]
MNFIADALKLTKEYNELLTAVKNKQFPCVLTGLSTIHKNIVSYSLFKNTNKSMLILCSDEADCHKIYRDLSLLGMTAKIYPAKDFSLRDNYSHSHEYEIRRLDALISIAKNQCDCIIAPIDAALQFTIPKDELLSKCINIKVGDEISQLQILTSLSSCGYEKAEQIDGTGQFSHRGGIIDFFSPDFENPIRLEFWGDEIDSISTFSVDTQRRIENIDSVSISLALEVAPNSYKNLAKKIKEHALTLRGKNAKLVKEILESECNKLENDIHIGSMDKFISLIYTKPATLFDYFDKDNSILVLSQSSNLKEKMRASTWQWNEDIKQFFTEGVLCKGLDKFTEDWVYTLAKAEEYQSIFMDTFARGTYEVPTKTLINFDVKQISAWGGSTQLLIEDITALLHRNLRINIFAGTERTAINVAEDLKEAGLPAAYFEKPSLPSKGTIIVSAGTLSSGFELPQAGYALISHGRISDTKQNKPKHKKDKNQKAIYSLGELSHGDYVVHSTHGIGIFQGIHKIDLKGIVKDYIKIGYAKNDTLYVPVTQLDLVAKYIGPRENSGVKLHRLGGAEWQKSKNKVKSAVKDIAKELIILYAKRMEEKGFAFPEDDEWQRDFESYFPYEETDDQLNCINEIKNDMESQNPMDRLLCGDVGFGKTEVALRAAFKCVTAGKQCAILVPTTLLAWQHYQLILKRMENFPIKIELLSRFRTNKQQDQILRDLKHGRVDIIVGTHRLVSKDVGFRDLGLVIIDEEQRFGVAQKEKLKDLCKTADILTLSATPIPRTLNMALSGIRDMSVIEEPPQDRHPVQTYVLEYDLDIISDAIKKELRRGGQAYYLHNDVASINAVAAKIQSKVPDARIGVGHGKMEQEELSEVWRQLVEHEIDILVCTTIIETGVDVPNANTLIIDNADKMGLSQLHQIRGRIGRSNRRAYAYLTYSQNKILTEVAQKRLTAIREFTEFGSGFKIAMRDLEIRGAGNVLGGEQHGHMESVGYDMYLKLLNEAVALLKGEDIPQESISCTVDIQIQAHIPNDYIESINNRLDIYRRIADIQTVEDSEDVIDELIDRFGEPPVSVQGIIDIALLRNTAASFGIKEIKQQNGFVFMYLACVNMEHISKLIGELKGRVLLSATEKPYISIKLLNEQPLDVLKQTMKILQN